MMYFTYGLLQAMLLIACAAEKGPEAIEGRDLDLAAVLFTDDSAQTGLQQANVSGGARQQYIIETMSAGAAFLDYNGDGWLDLFTVNGTRLQDNAVGPGNRLYRNVAGTNRRVFKQVSAAAGFVPGGWGMGCAVGDYDNDGDPDIYVTYWGANRLYENRGDGTFAETGAAAGVDDQGWGSSAAFADLDNDGQLDLYLTNYLVFDPAAPPGEGKPCYYKGLQVFCGPKWVPRQADKLYRNIGDGTFADISAATGVGQRRWAGMGVVFGDYDNDADLDIYVANDGDPNLLYRNDGAGRLVETGVEAGVAYTEDGKPQAGMGVGSGDYDNDGDLDLFVTNFSDDVNTLYRNTGQGMFRDATYAVGLAGGVRPFLGWSTGFFDYDNDGWLDLFVANGHLYPQLDGVSADLGYGQRNLLYRNRQGYFTEVGEQAGPGWQVKKVSRGAALGDYDNDGDIDLFIANINDTPTLLHNNGGNQNNWLGLRLVGTASNRDAIGARVRLIAGDLVQLREVHRGYGFQAQHDPRLVFGLGERQQVERLEIRWPSGRDQVVHAPPLRRYLTVREGDGIVHTGPVIARPSGTATRSSAAGQAPPERLEPAVGARAEWTADDYVQAGKTAYAEGRYGAARQLLEQALHLEPDHLSAYIAQAVVLHSGLGQYAAAAALLEEAVQRDSSWVDVHYWLGRVYLSQDRVPQAIQSLQRAVRLHPEVGEFYRWLGLAYLREGRQQQAITAFGQAVQYAPWEAGPHLHLARLYDELGQVPLARRERRLFDRLLDLEQRVERYQLQVEAYPQDARVQSNLAMAYAEQGRFALALDGFQQAVALDSAYGRAHYGMGKIHALQGRTEQAIQAYEQACRVDTELVEAFNELGQIYYEIGRYEQALAAYKRAVRLRPNEPLIYNNLGLTYTALGRFNEAIDAYQMALKRKPDLVKTRLALARLYTSQGRQQEARQEMRSLMQTDPDYRQAPSGVSQ